MNLKQKAAQAALDLVKDGMCLGLGSGSTASIFIEMLGARLKEGKLRFITGVPTSQATAALAQQVGIPLTSLEFCTEVDLALDGADEVDPDLNLIKGLGKALLREKIIEIHARRLVIIVDESKLVERLGRGPLPIEIVQFQFQAHLRWLASLSSRAELWLDEAGKPFVTDNGNYLARCWFEADGQPGMRDAYALAKALSERPGIVEHGLFLNMASEVIVAGQDGIRRLERKP